MMFPALFPVTPVFLGNLETLELDFLTLLEASELLLIADLQPKFDDNGAIVVQVPGSKSLIPRVGAQPVSFSAEAFNTLN